MKILCIQTGGTIDKDYPKTSKAYAFEISEPAMKRIFEKSNPAFEYDIISVLKKDSLDITAEDRQKIYDACTAAATAKIIITHGTDTMIETAKKLSSIKDKTIVITGSIRPERFSNSDASFNVGTAIGALSYAKPGVYIAMHGNVYAWDNVTLDEKTHQFVALRH